MKEEVARLTEEGQQLNQQLQTAQEEKWVAYLYSHVYWDKHYVHVPLYTSVYLCIPLYTSVYFCIPLYTSVYCAHCAGLS